MRSRSLFLGAAVAASAACGSEGPPAETDPRLTQLTVGMRRDSLLMALGSGGASDDSLANIYRREMYLFDGEPVEILFYHAGGSKEGAGVAVAESTLRPVVVTSGRVSGWGWTYFDSVARVNNIRARVR